MEVLDGNDVKEVVCEHITRREVDRIVERFDDGFKRLEAKIDDLAKAQRG